MLPIESLKDYFIQGFKKPDNLQIGVEWEKIGVYRENGRAIPYFGPRGVEAIFKMLVKKYGWTPIFSNTHVIALAKDDDSSITLEPGGQIELSGKKAALLEDNAKELHAHLKEIKAVSEPLGIVWLGLGVQPVSALEEIEWVPKERYRLMREKLKNQGTQSHAMMKQTASIQVSLDFTDHSDATEKLRLAMGLAPVLGALFSNSPVLEGKMSGFWSKRSDIWLQTDPARTGIIEKVFEPDFTLDDYIDYALNVPLLFIVRQGQWLDPGDMTFGQFLKNGWGHYRPTIEDWKLHLTTIFTQARLKEYLEIRCIDCQAPALGLAACALIKALFYSPSARKKAWELVKDWPVKDRKQLAREAPRQGLQTKIRGKTLRQLAGNLLSLAKEASLKIEEKYLAPLEAVLKNGKTPAEMLADRLKETRTDSFIKTLIEQTSLENGL
jgi:glutamate--cysteine ligase